jgi:hypothetical protein
MIQYVNPSFLNKPQQQTNWYKKRIRPFVNTLDFGTEFWMNAERVFDIWHERYIQI